MTTYLVVEPLLEDDRDVISKHSSLKSADKAASKMTANCCVVTEKTRKDVTQRALTVAYL